MLLEFSVRLIVLLPGLVLGLCLAGCDRQKADWPQGGEAPGEWAGPSLDRAAAPTGRLDRSHAGTPAPAASFRDPDGEPVTLADFRGRPLLVNLWATWCGPCVVEMPTLDALAARDGGVQVLAVSQDLEGRDKVEAFFEQGDFQALEPYLDPDMALMMELKVDTLPTTILYDAEGREVWRMTGREDWAGARAAGLLKEAV
jgi:thiol-disulfide isomerase/thioredoxin